MLEKVHEKAQRVINSEDLFGVKKDILKQLVENEVKELEKVKEKTTTENIDRIASIFLPAIKKIVRDSIVEEIVGVQPVKAGLPTALVQYIDFVYDSGDNAGQSVIDGPVTTTYSLSGEDVTINRGINVVVKTKSTDVKTRKLLSRWTFESQEATQFMGVNIEKEITKALGAKIVEEINYEIINLLYTNAAGGTTNWSMPAAGDTPSVKDRKEKEIFYAIEDVAGQIYEKTGRYPNYLIVSPTIASILRRNGQYVALGDRNNPRVSRLFMQGFLEDLGFKVYVVRSLGTNNILVGWKGESELEAGLIYAPQTPFRIMDTFFNVENWEFLKSVGASYAIAPVEWRVYGKVVVS